MTDPQHAIAEVLAGRADVGVGSGAGIERESELVVERFAPLRVHLACRPGHPLTRETGLTLERTLEYPLVATRLRGADAVQVMPGFAPAAVPHDVVPELVPPIVVNSLAMGRRIAAGSDALCAGFASQLADEVSAGRLVLLDVDDAVLRNAHAAYHRRDRPPAPAALAFLERLREVEAELQREQQAPRALARRRARA